ncbi:hypothetical protein C0416_02650 [bacterium]|nr:hypothetical protein [bacterium]
MKINTKTNKSIIISVMALVFMLSSAISFAAWDASSESNNCDGEDCRRWHNEGITHQEYPYGLNFASFNNYRDATKTGRSYKEMQFMYIESQLAESSNDLPLPTPWESWSNYNFDNGTSHTINFTNDEPVRIGFWGYIHNNGTANQYPATGSQIKLTGWSSSTPKTSYTPQYTLWAENTKPKTVWSNVSLSGNVPFTLTPVEAYIDREDGTWQFNEGQLQSITTNGIYIKSNNGNTSGRIDSSELHYVLVYLEFEAVPADVPGVCRSLTITDPTETSITLDENGFVNENLSFTADADPGVIHGYRISSTKETITFKANNAPEGIDIKTNDTSVKMNGGPTTSKPTNTVRVLALDQNGNGISSCMDTFNVKLGQEEENTCEVLNTTPNWDPNGQESPVPLNKFVRIRIDELLDTNGDPYTDNGETPLISYCYTNNDIDFLPDSRINYVLSTDGRCATAPANNNMSVVASSEGTMIIKVVGSPESKCSDVFRTRAEEIEGTCLDLSFLPRYETFDLTEQEEYCVTVDVEAEAEAAYNDNIKWMVERDGEIVFDKDTQGSECLNFDNYPSFDYEPGDTLIAEAIVIEYEGDDCIDELTSEEKECTRFELDRDTFERGTSQEVCIDYTDWPLDENDELEYSVNNGSPETVDLYEDSGEICFILTEDMVEDADIVRVWVPGWEDECNHELTRNVEPPSFDKNAKSADALAYSSRTIANFSDDYVNYRITYTHYNDGDQDVTITDTIGTEGYIQGYIAGTQTGIDSDTPEGGRIYYNEDSMRVLVDGDPIENCDDIDEEDLEDAVCYERNIGDEDGVEIKNVPSRDEVLVEYRGEIKDSSVNPENCSDPDSALNETGVCGEIYPNTAEFEDEANFNGSADAEVIIPCPFIIIRSGGETFFENPFDYGVDTLSCSEIRNVDTPVIVGIPPDDMNLFKTGGDVAVLRKYDDRLCNSTAEGSVDIKGISSLICELELTSKELTQQAIVQSLSRNVQLFARYSKNLNDISIVNGSSTLDNLSSSNDVYIKDKGGMLTLGGEFADKARTIVVINNDVYINNDLTFKDPENLNDPRKVPSLAVIVIGGNIVIDPSVEETNAVFFVQEGEGGKGGQICEAPKTGSVTPSDFCKDDTSLVDYNSESRLTHYGSIYGDIQHLLKYRVKSGDPTKEEGAILIRFDNRVYLNTPPLLNKLVDVSQKSF